MVFRKEFGIGIFGIRTQAMNLRVQPQKREFCPKSLLLWGGLSAHSWQLQREKSSRGWIFREKIISSSRHRSLRIPEKTRNCGTSIDSSTTEFGASHSIPLFLARIPRDSRFPVSRDVPGHSLADVLGKLPSSLQHLLVELLQGYQAWERDGIGNYSRDSRQGSCSARSLIPE